MADIGLGAAVLLALIALLGGIGITAVGPGGVLPTIGLFALTNLAPDQVAGTAIVTHVATGVLGTLAYARSGQLREPATRRTALVLAGAAVFGAPLGVFINTMVSKQVFGIILGVFAASIALILWRRDSGRESRSSAHPPVLVVAAIGFGVSTAAGIVGIGGPMLTVPILAMLGVPMLEALASAQVQSIVISSAGSIGYGLNGAIDWPLAFLVGLPELAGVLIGWKVARSVPGHVLKGVLIGVLLLLAPYLILRG